MKGSTKFAITIFGFLTFVGSKSYPSQEMLVQGKSYVWGAQAILASKVAEKRGLTSADYEIAMTQSLRAKTVDFELSELHKKCLIKIFVEKTKPNLPGSKVPGDLAKSLIRLNGEMDIFNRVLRDAHIVNPDSQDKMAYDFEGLLQFRKNILAELDKTIYASKKSVMDITSDWYEAANGNTCFEPH